MGANMITFILLFFFLILAVVFAGVAYSANRKRAGMSHPPKQTTRRSNQNHAAGNN